MIPFFSDDLLLSGKSARDIYRVIAPLPILDYHCHLDARAIAEDRRFSSLGELWLAGDHYKWRAMRLCGLPEEVITGGASYDEKFLAFAGIFPRLVASPLYYWCQMELKALFGITRPLNADSAPAILKEANAALPALSVRGLLDRFGVRYLATTNDPVESLSECGRYGDLTVAPTFRPDRFLFADEEALAELAKTLGRPIDTLDALKAALLDRLDFFCAKGCKIADHGSDFLPLAGVGEAEAASLFLFRANLDAVGRRRLFSHLSAFLCAAYQTRGIALQMHFGTYRNVNTPAFASLGKDTGFDVMRAFVDTDALVAFLNELTLQNALPPLVLYSLNPAALPAIATLAGAFDRVRIGAAWWFNDTVGGIREQLRVSAEYAVLGQNLGMLTDGRSFAGYVRFDFYRRLLADFLGGLVERGEADFSAALAVARALAYENAAAFLGLGEERK